MTKTRTAVLISGRGSNLAALLAAAAAPDYPAEISLVVSDRPDAGGLAHARAGGVTALGLDYAAFAGRAEFEQALQATLEDHRIDLVCLAGFMRLLSARFVAYWRDRLINIHPSLLPSFKGLNTHERALAAGVRIHGATVHFVRAEVDQGPIIAQGAVAVMPNDTPDSLAARILVVEHRLYPLALALVAGGKLRVEGEVVIGGPEAPAGADVLLSPLP